MVARVWRGYTARDQADAYAAMLKPELLPGLSNVKGYRGSYLLRRDVGDEVEFITIILWDSLDAIKAIAGERYERAVVPDERRKHLLRWEDVASHYEVDHSQGVSFVNDR